MTRPKRAAAQSRINYAANRGSDEEEQQEIEAKETDSGDEDFGAATASSDEDEEDEEDLDEAEYLDDVQESLPKKRARSTVTRDKQKPEVQVKGKGRARAGKLQLMVELPVDIWFMIVKYLDLPSLLYLGRANKMMRSLFASKSKSQALWNVVKRSAQLPELESTDLNDPALTSLLYERECHLCGKSRAPIVDFSLRKRYCSPCRSDDLFLENRLAKLIPGLTPYTVECSLYTARGKSGSGPGNKRYYSIVDTVQINEKILAFQAAIERAEGKTQKENANKALLQFIDSRQKIVQSSFRDSEKLVEWVDSSAEQRRAADCAAREARSNAIKAKLLELGHDQQDIDYACESPSRIRDLAWQPAALTSQIWKSISAKAIEEVESTKQRRLDYEASDRRAKVRPYYEELKRGSDGQHALPSFDIFATLPAVRPFWKEEDSTVDEHSWQSALEEINAQIPQARRRIQLEFARELLKAYDDSNHPFPERFRLSIHPQQANLFTYDSSNRRSIRAEINTQDSSTISQRELDTLLSGFIARFRPVGFNIQPSSWLFIYVLDSDRFIEGRKYGIPRHWLRTQLSVLSQTGLADSEETEGQLEELGARFHCENCHENTTGFWAKPQTGSFTWKEMVRHAFKYHEVQYYSEESNVWINYEVPTRRESPLNEA
ncbi:hypothetical protein JCM5350_003898 [Sporobolomyces pararoseus]